MRASVVIPVRNARSTLGQQLAALSDQNIEGPWEIIVVDNGSTDESCDVVAEWQRRLPNLRLVTEPTPGAGAARNAGARAATSPCLLFCDADDVVSPSWARALIDALDWFDLVGGALDCELLNSPRLLTSRNPIQAQGLQLALGHLPFASSANLGVRRVAFEAVGGFDTSLSPVEDCDFSWRVQYASFPIGFSAAAVVHYRYRNSLGGLMRQMYAYERNNAALYAKHHQLGYVAAPPISRYKITAFLTLRMIVGLPDLLHGRARWRYLGRAARCAGALAGIVKYRILPFSLHTPAIDLTKGSGE